jgi:hypothetical protein
MFTYPITLPVSYQPNGGPRDEPNRTNQRAQSKKTSAPAKGIQKTGGGGTVLFRISANRFSASAFSSANFLAASVFP